MAAVDHEVAGLLPQQEEALFDCLQAKDLPGLRDLLAPVPADLRAALPAPSALPGAPGLPAKVVMRGEYTPPSGFLIEYPLSAAILYSPPNFSTMNGLK